MNTEKNYWLHIIPISRSAAPEPTAKALLVAAEEPKILLTANEYPHPGGAAPSRGYLSWVHLEKALGEVAHIDEDMLQEAAREIKNGKTYTIPEVKLDERQIRALGLNYRP